MTDRPAPRPRSDVRRFRPLATRRPVELPAALRATLEELL